MLYQCTSLSLQPHPFSCTELASMENDLLIASPSSIQLVVFRVCLEMVSDVSAMSW